MQPINSIRTRLTLFYSLAVFILLGLAAIFLYWMTITLLYKSVLQAILLNQNTNNEFIDINLSNRFLKNEDTPIVF